MLISGAKNLFRVVTNRIYSPMAKTLSDYFLNPVYLIIIMAHVMILLLKTNLMRYIFLLILLYLS